MRFSSNAHKAFATIDKFFWSGVATVTVAAILLGTGLAIAWLIKRGLRGFTLLHYDLKQTPYVERIDLQAVGITIGTIVIFCLIWLFKDVIKHILGIEDKEEHQEVQHEPEVVSVLPEPQSQAASPPAQSQPEQKRRNSGTKKPANSRRKRF